MSQRVYRLDFSIVRGTKGCDIRLRDQSDLCVTAENPPPPENGGSPLSFGQVSRKPVAIRDTRSIDLVNFRNSEFSKISDSRIPRPRKCPVKGPYTDTENDRFWVTPWFNRVLRTTKYSCIGQKMRELIGVLLDYYSVRTRAFADYK